MPFGCGSNGPKESCVGWGSSGAEGLAMATNFGTKFAINWLCVNDSD